MSIILYSERGCSWCRGVLDLFAEKGMKAGIGIDADYEEREVLGNRAYFDELVAKSGQAKTPTLDIDGEILADSDREAVAVYLKGKGHPKFV